MVEGPSLTEVFVHQSPLPAGGEAGSRGFGGPARLAPELWASPAR